MRSDGAHRAEYGATTSARRVTLVGLGTSLDCIGIRAILGDLGYDLVVDPLGDNTVIALVETTGYDGLEVAYLDLPLLVYSRAPVTLVEARMWFRRGALGIVTSEMSSNELDLVIQAAGYDLCVLQPAVRDAMLLRLDEPPELSDFVLNAIPRLISTNVEVASSTFGYSPRHFTRRLYSELRSVGIRSHQSLVLAASRWGLVDGTEGL